MNHRSLHDEPPEENSASAPPAGEPAAFPAASASADRPPQQRPFTPLLTYGLLGLTIAVYFGQLLSQSVFGFDWLAELGLKDNLGIARGELWRLITPMFLHASVLHIGFNMYALYIFGPTLERYFGRPRFLALYVISGFAGNVGSLMFSASDSLGSSTAIFGLLGAQGVFLFQNREVLGERARRAFNQIVILAAVNLFIIGRLPRIDNWGHLGGLIGGTLFAWFGGPLLEVQPLLPPITVRDRRTREQVVLAAALVALLFGLLAAATIFSR